MGARVASGEDFVMLHTQDHWGSVWVLAQALDVSIWLLPRVRRQHWPVDLRTLGICKRNGQPTYVYGFLTIKLNVVHSQATIENLQRYLSGIL